MISSRFLLFAAVLVACGSLLANADDQLAVRPRADRFEAKIRPLLIQNCAECHGANKQESGLRLDVRSGAFDGGDRGPAIVPNDVDASLLIEAIRYETEDLQMPPDGRMEQDEIDLLTEWIAAGAFWPAESQPAAGTNDAHPVSDAVASHWAYQPIRKPALPQVKHADWVRNPIDHFVFARLEQAGLAPSPMADDHALVRRLHLDLWGLPADDDTGKAFRQDASDEAYRALVDRLLADERYAQRWARHWLDVARYADTKGYTDGGNRELPFAYTYRDYVIRAFYEDLPFDQFVMDQLAADQMDYSADQRWRMAGGGFLTVGRYFNFNPYDILDDRIDVITRGLLGLTASCARCHDHKYDPIPSADYYSLYGILNSSYLPHHSRLPLLVEPNVPSEAESKYVAEMNERTAAFENRFDQLHHQIEDELRKFAADYLVYIVQESVRHRLGETNPVFTERTYLRAPTAYGYGAVRRWRNYIDSRSEHDPVFGIWKRMDSFDKTEFAAAFAEQLRAWHGNTAWKQQLADSPPESMVELARRLGQLFESIDQQWKTFVSQHPDANRLQDDATEQLRQSLMGPGSPTVLTPLESVDCYQLDEHVELRNLQGKTEELTVDFPDAAARAMLLRDRDEPVEANVFLRGQPDRLGSDVDRHLPTLLLASLANDAKTNRTVADEFAIHRGSGRMELAKAIIDRRNPLTARVIVNRMWQWHFGQALVDSMDDFGSRSQPPTHPELLDYLAWWLMAHDWSLKELNRLMVTSHTFCQSNSSRTDAMQMDPANQLYWRFVPRRAEWEVIRDSLLAVSGRLDQKRNGPSIPLSPDDPDATCRTIFLRIDRQHASGFATNFDFPVPDMTVGKRPITSVPQQQLFFLNSPFVRKQAEALAGTVVQFDGKTDNAKIDWLFQKLFAREPTDTERSAVIDYRQNVSRALSADAPVDAELSEMESWIRTAHALLQLNELIYVP